MATLSILLNRSSYSNDEYTTVNVVNTDALFVLVSGLSLSSLGSITAAGNGVFTLNAGAQRPAVTFVRSDGTTIIPEFACAISTVEVADPANLNAPQLLTFPVQVTQTGNVSGFIPGPAGFAEIFATATLGADSAPNAQMQFIGAAAPFMRYGQTSWLSIDTYVFKTRDNGTGAPTGLPQMTSTQTPKQYLATVLAALDANPALYNTLPTASNFTSLTSTLYNTLPVGSRTYNFALTRVRYLSPNAIGLGTTAVTMGKARMFFRVCRMAVGSISYDGAFAIDPNTGLLNDWFTRDAAGNPTATPAVSSDGAYAWQKLATPLEDVQGNGTYELMRRLPRPGYTGSPLVLSSLPCFGDSRVEVSTNNIDSTNAKPIQAATPNIERYTFFGALIDLNDSTVTFPTQPGGSTPVDFPSLIVNMHCCLLVEIDLSVDVGFPKFIHPILNGNTPSNHDSLGMRNLVIV
jgi:hypothetical protein